MSDIQLRGHCQCCGRVQAVPSVTMSKHGYTVEHGWFQGVCHGHNYRPMEVDTTRTAEIVQQVREDCAELRKLAAEYTAGRKHPARAKTGRSVRNPETRKYEDVTLPWAEASEYERRDTLEAAIWSLKSKATSGESFAAGLEKLAQEVHGKPLQQVKRDAGPAPILVGERRLSEGGNTLTCTRVQGPRVYWQRDRDGKTFSGWTGTQAWRKFEQA